jgi:hypothetical protein
MFIFAKGAPRLAGCPDENLVIDFIQGLLPPESTCRVEEHVDRCSQCRRLLAELARWTAPAAGQPTDPPQGQPPQD